MREPPVSENEITSSKSSRGASESADSIGDVAETLNTSTTSSSSKVPSTGGGTSQDLEDDRSIGQPEKEPKQVNQRLQRLQNKDDLWCFDTIRGEQRCGNNRTTTFSSRRARQRYYVEDEEDVLLGRRSIQMSCDRQSSCSYPYENQCDESDNGITSDFDDDNDSVVGGDEDRCFLDNQPTCTMAIENPEKETDRNSVVGERKQSVGSNSTMDENSNSSTHHPPSRPESRGSDMVTEDKAMKSASRDHQQHPPVPSSHFISPPPSAQPLASSSSFSNVPDSAYINNLLSSRSGQSPTLGPSPASLSSFQPHPGLPSYMQTSTSTALSTPGGHVNPPKAGFGGGVVSSGGAGRIEFPMNNPTYPSPFSENGGIGGKGQVPRGPSPMDRGVVGMSLSNNLSEFLPKSGGGGGGIPHSSNEQWKGMFAMPNSGDCFPPHQTPNAMPQPTKMMFSPPPSTNTKKKTPEKGNLDNSNNTSITNNNDGLSTDRRGTPSPFTNSSPSSSRNATTPVSSSSSSSPSSSSMMGGGAGGRPHPMLTSPGVIGTVKKQESLSAAAAVALNKGMSLQPPSASIPGATSGTGATGSAPAGKVVSIHPGSPQYHQIFIYQHQLLIMQFQQYQFQLQAQFQQLRIQQMSPQQMAILSQQFHQQMMLLQQQFNQQQVCSLL